MYVRMLLVSSLFAPSISCAELFKALGKARAVPAALLRNVYRTAQSNLLAVIFKFLCVLSSSKIYGSIIVWLFFRAALTCNLSRFHL